jgi:hypothetical protein
MRKTILSLIFLILSSSFVFSQVPQTISYQGLLKNSEGTYVKDGEYNISFNLYETSTGGSSLWAEKQKVSITQGLFNVILGSVKPINLSFNKQYWLGITIENTTELLPRIQLTSSAYSLNSQTVADSSVTSSKILSGNVVKSLNGLTDKVTLAGTGNVSISQEGNTLTINGTPTQIGNIVKSLNGLSDAVTLAGAGNVSISQVGNTLTINGTPTQIGNIVKSINGLTDNITLAGAGNVSVSQDGNVLTITGTSGASSYPNIIAGSGLTGGGATQSVTLSLNTGFTDNLYVNEGQVNSVSSGMIQNLSVGTSKIATGSITTSKISNAGASSGNVLMYDGTDVLWQTPSTVELSLPYSSGINSSNSAFEIINSGTGIAGDFLSSGDLALGGYNNGLGQVAAFSIDNAANDNAALMSSTNGTGPAGYFLGEGASSKGVYISVPAGNAGLMVASGTKNAIVATSQGARKLYTEESSEVWFTEYGFGKLVDGHLVIAIDKLFAETVNLSEPYHVFLEEYSDADLYVSNRTPTSFEVKLRNGDQNADFSYRIVAKRKGYEQARLEHESIADDDPNLFPAKRAEFAAKKNSISSIRTELKENLNKK